MGKLSEFMKYFRFNLCCYAVFMTGLGYILSGNTIPVWSAMVTSFFLCAAVYSYNNITDQEEDKVNRKKINYFVENGKGKWFTAAFVVLGFVFSYPHEYFPIYLLLIASGLLYSRFRIKKIIALKTVYTSVAVTGFFLIGAAGNLYLVSLYALFLTFFTAVGSILSDLRDFKGDKSAHIHTIPVVLGSEVTKLLVYILCGVLIYGIFFYRMTVFYPILTFAIVIAMTTFNNNFKLAHALGGISFIALIIWNVILYFNFSGF